MRIAVIGATGRTGTPLVHQQLPRGHDAHRTGASSIRRADLAASLVEVVEQDLYPMQAPFVWNR